MQITEGKQKGNTRKPEIFNDFSEVITRTYVEECWNLFIIILRLCVRARLLANVSILAIIVGHNVRV